MKTVFEHIERVKEEPHHIRKQIAFGAAASLTAFIALVWLVGSIGTGAFVIKDTSFADNVENESETATSKNNNNDQLAGAASAVKSVNAPARIEIVNSVSSASSKKAEQTTIPF